MNIVDINGGQRRISSAAATNKAAFLGSAAIQGVDPNMIAEKFEGANSGFAESSIGIKSEAYRSLSVDFGRFSPQELKILTALKETQKPKSGEIIIKESSDKKFQ